MCMLEWTSIPAASGLMTCSAAFEAGMGMGNDRSGASLGLVGFLRLARFFGSSFGTTMEVSGWRMRVGKTTGRREPRGDRETGSLPNGINTTPGKPGMASRQ